MPNLIANHTGAAFQARTIQEALNEIKISIEAKILESGEAGKNALIRSQKPIKLIHDVIKTDFLSRGVHPSLINPGLDNLRSSSNATSLGGLFDQAATLQDKELALTGFLKTKNQDVCIVPRNIPINTETLTYPTYIYGVQDPYGHTFTENVLSINVRSQLSSLAKNFDTLYERTFAEALNFHLRSNRMVLGEVYLIVTKEYDPVATAQKQIRFKAAEHVEKYIRSFQALNGRNDVNEELYKYERVALLVVDFSQSPPKLYNTTQELMDDGLLLSTSQVNMESLSYNTFTDHIFDTYKTRFPNNSFN